MAFCVNCGKELQEDSMFCPECGEKAADTWIIWEKAN
ncbi:MAG: zinc-ribbon domain-containing protein [Clostridiales bacterium]|nr:zinc-ribbon domain-containing protein [Clostridiales bacterium]